MRISDWSSDVCSSDLKACAKTGKRNMTNVVVIGSQWGDEGKGKIVDWLSERADIVVRFQGGHNAGHTLVIDGVSYKRSEERRVGTEGVSTGRSRWSPYP